MGRVAKGVLWVPVSSGGSITIHKESVDKDYYYLATGTEQFCGNPKMEDYSAQANTTQNISLSTPMTHTITSPEAAVNYSGFVTGCPSGAAWFNDVSDPAVGFVHVYEIELEATPQGNGAHVTWSITPFSGSASGDVTPNHLMVSVTGDGGTAAAGPYSGWSGSVDWDGNYAGGGSWDGCSQVEFTLGVAPPPYPTRYGLPGIIVNDFECGGWTYSCAGVSKSICFPCPCEGGEPALEICSQDPDIEFVCPGCAVNIQARDCPIGECIEWEITENPDNLGHLSTTSGTSTTFSVSSSAEPGEGEKTFTVKASLCNYPSVFEEIELTYWSPDSGSQIRDSWPFEGKTEAEVVWALQHPICAAFNSEVGDTIGPIVNENFGGTICDNNSDNTAGNAFKHALFMCMIASNCDTESATDLGKAHENFAGNNCDRYTMDLHNNNVGIGLSQEPGDCEPKALQALQDGRLLFYPEGTAVCGGLESDYNQEEDCPPNNP